MPDFRVQRGICVMSGAATTSNTVPIEAVDTTRAYVRLLGGNQAGMFFKGTSGVIGTGTNNLYGGNPEFPTSSGVRITRQNSTNAVAADRTFYYWEVVEYVGPNGGPNEWVVRLFGNQTTTSTTTLSVLAGVALSDLPDIMSINCGVSNSLNVGNSAVRQMQTNAGNFFGFPVIGGVRSANSHIGTPDTVRMTIAAVHLVGSGWGVSGQRVQTISHTINSQAAPEFVAITDVDWNRTWMNVSWRTTGTTGAPQACALVFPGSGDELTSGLITFAQTQGQASSNTWAYNVHLASNPQMQASYARCKSGDSIASGADLGWTNPPDGPMLMSGAFGNPRPEPGFPSGIAPGSVDVIPSQAWPTFVPISGQPSLLWVEDHSAAVGKGGGTTTDQGHRAWGLVDIAATSGSSEPHGGTFEFRKHQSLVDNHFWSAQAVAWPIEQPDSELCTAIAVGPTLNAKLAGAESDLCTTVAVGPEVNAKQSDESAMCTTVAVGPEVNAKQSDESAMCTTVTVGPSLAQHQSATAAMCVSVCMESTLAPENPCDWFEPGGAAWQAAAAGASWLNAGGGPWAAAVSGNDWYNPDSGGWFDPKDC